jgi:formamidopyrimidine-DNA glycosylase
MPELPEVETVAADLRPLLAGRRFADAHVLWPRTVAEPDPTTLAERIHGRQVIDVGRRGKYLQIALDSGEMLVFHLRMTGQLAVVSDGDPALTDSHLRAWFDLDSGEHLVFVDARKFGRIWLVDDIERVVGRLGPEPLDWTFTPEVLAERLRGRRSAIKTLLLDQTVVAGLGNIYADEALFMAGIHPLRPAAGLSTEEVVRLHDAIRQVLREAVSDRGTLLRDYRTPYGPEATHQEHLRVYRQTDRPCPRCGTAIQRIRVSQRSTHFCPHCQPVG